MHRKVTVTEMRRLLYEKKLRKAYLRISLFSINTLQGKHQGF